MNYMKDVAKLLGVEIGEKFKLKNPRIDKTFDSVIYKLTQEGLIEYSLNVTEKRYVANTLQEILYGKLEIIKLPKPILTDKEKKYLSLIIKPWKNEIKYMVKIGCDDMEYIMIVFDDLKEMPFPHFKKGKYYKGMEWDKEYSLEELGL